jgi:hypothetical protein
MIELAVKIVTTAMKGRCKFYKNALFFWYPPIVGSQFSVRRPLPFRQGPTASGVEFGRTTGRIA